MPNEYSARYKRYQKDRKLLKDSDCTIALGEKSLVISPGGEDELSFGLTELEHLSFSNHKVSFVAPDGERIELYYLSDFSEISENIRQLRTREIIKNLLIEDTELRATFKCLFKLYKDSRKGSLEDKGEIHLFPSFFVLIPKITDFLIILYNDLRSRSFDRENKLIILKLYTGETLEISDLDEYFADFEKLMETLIEDLLANIKKRFQKTLSGVSVEVVRKLVNLVKNGRSVEKVEVDKIDGSLWKQLEALITKEENYKKTYEFLKLHSISESQIRIGLQEKGGELSPWYQIPLMTKTGSYIAVECLGQAMPSTFLFKVVSLDETILERTMEFISKTLVFLNFNFSGFFMTKTDIMEGDDKKIKVIFNKFDFLIELKKAFFFRVPFFNYQKWERDLKIILGF